MSSRIWYNPCGLGGTHATDGKDSKKERERERAIGSVGATTGPTVRSDACGPRVADLIWIATRTGDLARGSRLTSAREVTTAQKRVKDERSHHEDDPESSTLAARRHPGRGGKPIHPGEDPECSTVARAELGFQPTSRASASGVTR